MKELLVQVDFVKCIYRSHDCKRAVQELYVECYSGVLGDGDSQISRSRVVLMLSFCKICAESVRAQLARFSNNEIGVALPERAKTKLRS